MNRKLVTGALLLMVAASAWFLKEWQPAHDPATSSAAGPRLGVGTSGGHDTIPFEMRELHAYVQVSVNGSEPMRFLVDSGAAAPLNLIDSGVVARLGLSVEGGSQASAIGGSARVSFTAEPVALQIGSTKVPPAKLGVMQINDQESSHAVAGILGFPFFDAFSPEIDYPKQRLWLSPTTREGFRQDSIPLEVIDKACRIKAMLTFQSGRDPVPVTLVVDTGYDGNLVLTRPFVEKHRLLGRGVERVGGGALGGATSGQVMKLEAIKIGQYMFHKVETRLATDKEGAFASSEVDGYLGTGILKDFSVHFDYAHARLTLTR